MTTETPDPSDRFSDELARITAEHQARMAQIVADSEASAKQLLADMKARGDEMAADMEQARAVSREAIFRVVVLSGAIVGFSATLLSIESVELNVDTSLMRLSWLLFAIVIVLGPACVALEARAKYAMQWRAWLNGRIGAAPARGVGRGARARARVLACLRRGARGPGRVDSLSPNDLKLSADDGLSGRATRLSCRTPSTLWEYAYVARVCTNPLID